MNAAPQAAERGPSLLDIVPSTHRHGMLWFGVIHGPSGSPELVNPKTGRPLLREQWKRFGANWEELQRATHKARDGSDWVGVARLGSDGEPELFHSQQGPDADPTVTPDTTTLEIKAVPAGDAAPATVQAPPQQRDEAAPTDMSGAAEPVVNAETTVIDGAQVIGTRPEPTHDAVATVVPDKVAEASGDAPFAFTRFADVKARTAARFMTTWSGLFETLRAPPTAREKASLPLLKLATFGDAQTANGSLRHDANVVEITGIVADYDGEVMTPQEAVERLERALVRAFIYTSPSHGLERPRFRVIAALSAAASPSAHPALMARLNGALGGILAPESFTLSQAYYYGRVEGREYACLATFDDPTDGTCIDQLDDLDDIAIGKREAVKTPGNQPGAPVTSPGVLALATARVVPIDPRTDTELRSALASMRADDRDLWVRMGMALKTLGDTGRGMWLMWSATSPKFDPADAARRWDSFEPTSTDHRAVFAEAQRLGWINPMSNAATGASGALQTPVAGSGGIDAPSSVDAPPARLDACIVDLAGADELADSEHPHVIADIVPDGEVTICAGHGGAGKSYVWLMLAVLVALGMPLDPIKVRRARVVFFSGEDDRETLLRRVGRICRALDVNPRALEGWLFLLDVSDQDPTLYGPIGGGARTHGPAPLLNRVADFVTTHDIGLTILDNASDVFAGNEIARAEVRGFMRASRQRLARPDRAVVLLAHVSKAAAAAKGGRNATDEDYSGSSAWHNSARSRLTLESDEKTGRLVMHHRKANRGVKVEPIYFEWAGGAPVPEGTCEMPGAALAAKLREQSQRRQDDRDKDAIVTIIKDFDKRGERVPTAIQGGHTVFKTFEGVGALPAGMTSQRLNQLVRELEGAGTIFRSKVYTSGRKWVDCFTCSTAIVESALIQDQGKPCGPPRAPGGQA